MRHPGPVPAKSCVAKLHARARQAVRLYASGLKTRDIARELGSHAATVGRWVHSEPGRRYLAEIEARIESAVIKGIALTSMAKRLPQLMGDGKRG